MRLEDILENAQAVLRYAAGMDLKTFEEDRKTCDAVERCLESARAQLSSVTLRRL